LESDRIMFKRALFCLLILAIGVALAAPAWASGGEPAGEGDINPLSWSAVQMNLALWTTVVFVCLAAVLYKFAWGPLAAALDKREQGIAGQIADAEAANRKAQDILAGYEKKLADAKNEVRGIIEQGRREAEKIGRDMLDKAKDEAAGEHALALQQIEAATDAAVKSLADRSAEMAVDLAGKIVGAKLSPKDHTRLIEQAVGGFAGKTDASRN
jgi:F-type H+-transporting ATPase subunit b